MALLLVGASPAVFTDYPVHCHDCWEIIMNLSGEGIAEIGGREYPFSPGTIHVIPPNTPHTKRAAAGFRDLYLHTDSLDLTERSPSSRRGTEEPVFLTDDESRTMENLFSLLLSRYLLDPNVDEITETLFHVVLRYVETWRRRSMEDPVVNGLIHTITLSYSDPEFQVTEALVATGYSKDHLRRRFRQATGMTPNEYLKTVRIRYAKKLLSRRETLHLAIRDIALMCGYYDPDYFCRSFRKETGMSPSDYCRTGD